MNEETMKRALTLRSQIRELEEHVKAWETQEEPLHPCHPIYREFADSPSLSLMADRDTWAIYRRRSIEKVAALLDDAKAEYKAL